MANPEHLAILEQGVDTWNKWWTENPAIRPDLSCADLTGFDLKYANLKGANLKRANLSGADLSRANLDGTDLDGANLNGAKFINVDLRFLIISGLNLYKTDVSRSDLRGCNLIDTILEGAILTGARLWEIQRSGWSIKGVICEYAYFDRDGIEKTDFKSGEFEKLYSDKTKIVLHYEDGMNQFEVTTLPALIQFIESRHPGSSLRLRTIGEDAGGASVTVAVDELGDADLSILREDFENYKKKIREEVLRDAQIEILVLQGVNKSLTEIIKGKMGGDTYQISGSTVNGPIGRQEGTVYKPTIVNNDLDAISKLISDILAARTEIETVLPSEKANEFNAAFEIIQEQASAPQKNFEKMKQAARSIKNILMSTGDLAGKWAPLAEKLYEALHQAGQV
jgi:hypothetical protein